MGMELVLITDECEAQFGVEITNEDWAAPEMQRVEGLYRLILRKLNLGCGHFCLSSRVFYRLRRALMDALGVPRQAVRPDAAAADLVGPGDLRPVWAAIGERIGWDLAPLRRPLPLDVMCYALPVLAGLLLVGVAACAGYEWGWRGALALGMAAMVPAVIAGAVLGHFVDQWTGGERRCLPQDCGTVGGLVRATIRTNYAEIRKAEEDFAVTREEVWEHLQQLIARELSVPLRTVTPASHWARDLRAD